MMIRRLALMLLLAVTVVMAAWAETYPAQCRVNTTLNVREGAGTWYGKVGRLHKGDLIEVKSVSYGSTHSWGYVEFPSGAKGYVAMEYVTYVGPVASEAESSRFSGDSSSSSHWSGWSWLFGILGIFVGIIILRALLSYGLRWISSFVYRIYLFVSFPFYVLNWLQRYLSKPWLPFTKWNTRIDSDNADMRDIMSLLGWVCYAIVTPLRAFNAIYYNLVVHWSFEMLNYTLEVIDPCNSKEGNGNILEWLLWLPYRIVKYPLYHGALTLVECIIWTVVDTFLPALTLYHGTTGEASVSITQCPGRVAKGDWYTGIWNVGSGNYAGDGIYFAPARNTAIHYSSGALIVCRVTLGRTLDLGLAPRNIYNQCGKPDAHQVTEWGLKNNYVTGEWWRGDSRAGWWEYCMYDWKNRYNYSWRIRPLYVLDLTNESIQRIPGGMAHWLFRSMVIEDIATSIEEHL